MNSSRTWSILGGLIALILGIVLLVWPGQSLVTIVWIFGLFALLYGFVKIGEGIFRRGLPGNSRTWFILGGLASLLLGVLMMAWPGATILLVVWLIAFRAILVGIFELIVGFSEDEARWLVRESTDLVENAPAYYQKALEADNPVSNYLQNSNFTADLLTEEKLGNVFNYSNTALNLLGGIFNSIIAVITVIAFTFYMVLEGPRLMSIFWRYQPRNKLEHRKRLIQEMYRSVTGYVNGSISRGVLAGVITSIFLLILGAPYIIALGILMAIFSLIPLIGATIAAVFITLVIIIFSGVGKALIAIVFFIIYQQVENYLIQPVLFSKSINISPLAVAIAALLGAYTAGLIGALVAIPLAASLQILVKDYLENKRLETEN